MFKYAKKLIYLKRDSIEILQPGAAGHSFHFTKKAADDLEIIDEKKFSDELLKFLVAENVDPSSAVIIISNDHLFEKVILAKTEKKKEKEISEFMEEVPFDTTKREDVTFPNKKGILVVAFNKGYYNFVTKLFKENGWKIKGVVVETPFGKEEMQEEKITNILSDSKTIKKNNLLKMKTKTDGPKNKSRIALIVALIVILAALLGSGIYIFIKYSNKNKVNDEQQVVIEEDTPTEEQITQNEVEDVVVKLTAEEREIYTIQILNGTGVSGLAGKTQDELEELGYTNIEIGNASNSTGINMEFSYSSGVDPRVIEELENYLKDNFENVAKSEFDSGNTSDTFDIIIVTGTLFTE